MSGERTIPEHLLVKEFAKTIRVTVEYLGPDPAWLPWMAFARRVELRHYVGPIQTIRWCFEGWMTRLQLRLLVPSRETREIVWVEISKTCDVNVAKYDVRSDAVERFFASTIEHVTLHELRECVYDGNRRFLDPHAGDRG